MSEDMHGRGRPPQRVVDRFLDAPGKGQARGEVHPDRPSCAQRAHEIWCRALTEAKFLLSQGATAVEAAEAVSWTLDELELGLKAEAPSGDKPPSQLRERTRRTLSQRVAGLKNASRELMRRARHLYEIEFMTVKEVSDVIGLPNEQTYLILIKAKTPFRRPGRRKR